MRVWYDRRNTNEPRYVESFFQDNIQPITNRELFTRLYRGFHFVVTCLLCPSAVPSLGGHGVPLAFRHGTHSILSLVC